MRVPLCPSIETNRGWQTVDFLNLQVLCARFLSAAYIILALSVQLSQLDL